MGKAFQQMNVRLDKAVTDMTGKTGTLIIEAVLAGERDPSRLAALRDRRCKKSEEEILRALSGDFREEHVYALGIAHRMYNSIQAEIQSCEAEISKCLHKLVPTTAALRAAYSKLVESEDVVEEKSDAEMVEMVMAELLPDPHCDRKDHFKGLLGVDATAIPGVDVKTITELLSEVGLDFSKWENSARFASWLGLSPCVKKSGVSKNLRHHTKKVQSRAAEALRMAASSVTGTDTHLGDFYRRLKSRHNAAVAITATARKIAVIFFEMVTKQREFVELGPGYRQKRNPGKYVAKTRRKLMELGYQIIPLEKPEETGTDMAAGA
jgi:transposase